MWVICDIEGDSLYPSVIWCITCIEVDNGKVHHFLPSQYDDFKHFSKSVSVWVGHKFLTYDAPHLRRLLQVDIANSSIIDTLVVSRLLNYSIDKGHSLEAWGERLGIPKLHSDISFDIYTPELSERNIRDCETNLAVFNHFKEHIFSSRWKDALRTEHFKELLCEEIHTNGFFFNHMEAKSLFQNIQSHLNELDDQLASSFPPSLKLIREISPSATKFGTLNKKDFRFVKDANLSPYSVNSPFSLCQWEEFNPGSSKQRIDILNKAGWKPFEKTKGHIEAERELKFCKDPQRREELNDKLAHYKVYGWKTSEDNLSTLPEDAPEGTRKLVQWLLLSNRLSTLTQYEKALSEAPEPFKGDTRIHGQFNAIGAWTHRVAHDKPNMANPPAVKTNSKKEKLYGLDGGYGIEIRSLFTVPQKRLLVGTDADGIQLRIFGHYVKDADYIRAIVNGKSELGTDAHTLNQSTLNSEEFICKTRDNAKTFIYAFLLGAGVAKIATIFGCSHSSAKRAKELFIDNTPGLDYLKNIKTREDAERGYFEGIDGRYVMQSEQRLMLAGYLQNAETIIMTKAAQIWKEQLDRERIFYKLVNWPHDEWQTEVEDNIELAKYVGQVQCNAITEAGEYYNLLCPFKGNSKFGKTWFDTH